MKTLYSAFSSEGHGEPRRAGEQEARDPPRGELLTHFGRYRVERMFYIGISVIGDPHN